MPNLASPPTGFACILAAILLPLATANGEPVPAPVEIAYWDKWTGFEADAMRSVIEDFHRSQSEIRVRYLSVSQIERKLLLATAGRNPPDVAGIWAHVLPAYVENNALHPLDALARKAGISGDDYLPVFWDACRHQGFLWALPTTPAVTALHWNKQAFRDAGLDPERPPSTLGELEEMNDRLLLRAPDGRILRIGHSPQEPGWWMAFWPAAFGAVPWSPEQGYAPRSEGVRACFDWFASYTGRFGVRELQSLRNGFGNFASSQNPFFTGRVAMVMQGPWMHTFIRDYAPRDFEWGVAPFPSAVPGQTAFSISETDVLVIPAGSRHLREAFAFIAFVSSPASLEKLCLGQRKFSPRKVTTPEFYAAHPNPHIRTFAEIAATARPVRAPASPVWAEYTEALNHAADLVFLGRDGAESSLEEVETRIRGQDERMRARWDRVRDARTATWNALIQQP